MQDSSGRARPQHPTDSLREARDGRRETRAHEALRRHAEHAARLGIYAGGKGRAR